MTDVIAAGAQRYASPGTQTVALRPHFGPEAVDRTEGYQGCGDRQHRRAGAPRRWLPGRSTRCRPRRPCTASSAPGSSQSPLPR